ncbi:MAG: hypothetical protein GY849_01005 [Deltaproteobacteria bacterium]|nr:hypothetical protein [Deltaproteobacteria bacterium]
MKNMHPIEKITLAFVFILVITGVILSHAAPQFFKETYVVEDGPIQWLQVAALIMTMCLCFGRVVLLRKSKPTLFVAATLLLGLLFLFAVGEEISWGQRLFNIESSEWFQEHNAQEEMNLHNLVVKGTKINRLIFSTGLGIIMILYLVVITPLYRRKGKLSRLVDALAIPIPQTHHVIGYIALVLVVQFLVASSKKGELREFGMLFLFFLNVAFPYNKEIFDSKNSV